MPFTIVRNDIVNMEVDAIVNSAGSRTSRIGGVEGSILNVGGPVLRKEQLDLGDIPISEARYTNAPNLPSKYVIHVRGPIYRETDEVETHLRNSYRNTLNLAKELHIDSIAIPLISGGSYGYPVKRVLVIAQEEILKFLENNELMIYLVVFDKKSFTISREFQMEVKQYIRTGYVVEKQRQMRSMNVFDSMERRVPRKGVSIKKSSLDEKIENVKAGFTATLLNLIDETGQKDSYVYKKANIDRKLFSKIRNNPHYKPSKNTILAFSIALELSVDKTNDLLSRAGYILSESILFDVIISYCINNGIFNIYDVNNMLFYYDQELLGSH